MLGYLRDSNAAAHSFYNECKVVSYRDEFVLVCINFMHDDTLMATCDKGSWQKSTYWSESCRLGHEMMHIIEPPFYQIMKTKDVEIEAAEI